MKTGYFEKRIKDLDGYRIFYVFSAQQALQMKAKRKVRNERKEKTIKENEQGYESYLYLFLAKLCGLIRNCKVHRRESTIIFL